jgi:hypothetical protein
MTDIKDNRYCDIDEWRGKDLLTSDRYLPLIDQLNAIANGFRELTWEGDLSCRDLALLSGEASNAVCKLWRAVRKVERHEHVARP